MRHKIGNKALHTLVGGTIAFLVMGSVAVFSCALPKPAQGLIPLSMACQIDPKNGIFGMGTVVPEARMRKCTQLTS